MLCSHSIHRGRGPATKIAADPHGNDRVIFHSCELLVDPVGFTFVSGISGLQLALFCGHGPHRRGRPCGRSISSRQEKHLPSISIVTTSIHTAAGNSMEIPPSPCVRKAAEFRSGFT